MLAGTAAALAGTLSIGRIWWANRDAFDDLVWAEDGLFPLCVRAHDVVSCAVEPYSGFLHLVPRLVAWPVSRTPLDAWPLTTNAAAAVLTAALAGVTVLVLRANGSGAVTGVVVALLPTLVPIMSFETINVTASVYLPMLFVAAVAVCLPPRGRFPTWAYAAGLFVVAMTIPSSAILLVPLAVTTARGRVPRTSALVVAAVMVIGLAAQAVALLTAAVPRPMNWQVTALRGWIESVPSALLTFWPGHARLSESGSFTPSGPSWLGPAVVAAVVVLGVVLVAFGDATANGAGLLLLTGLFLGAVPAAAGYANNRYFVIATLLWLAAGLVVLDRMVPRREVVVGVVAVAATIAWLPGLPASDLRSTAVPPWPSVLAQARATCAANPDAPVALTFTPSWPFADAVFPGPTSNVVDCRYL